jgi:hypothetical protein
VPDLCCLGQVVHRHCQDVAQAVQPKHLKRRNTHNNNPNSHSHSSGSGSATATAQAQQDGEGKHCQ